MKHDGTSQVIWQLLTLDHKRDYNNVNVISVKPR